MLKIWNFIKYFSLACLLASLKVSGNSSFLVAIPKNTILFDIKKSEDIKIHKNLVSRALNKSSKYKLLTIVNNKGEPHYLVEAKKVVVLEKDISLFHNPKKINLTSKAKVKNFIDKKFNLSHQISIQNQFISGAFFQDSTNQEKKNLSINSTSLSWDIYFLSKLPLNLGFATNFSLGSSNYSEIDVGIALKTKKLNFKYFPAIQLSFYGLQTLLHKVQWGNTNLNLSTNILRLKVSSPFSIKKVGLILAGFSLSKNSSSIKGWQSQKVKLTNERDYLSYGFFLGYQFQTPYTL
ncbi:hypothetical protein OAK75_06530 [Bacteriovoracales bacterium]|nr:hypothetical protein [Bacteriovoracales bacterium]